MRVSDMDMSGINERMSTGGDVIKDNAEAEADKCRFRSSKELCGGVQGIAGRVEQSVEVRHRGRGDGLSPKVTQEQRQRQTMPMLRWRV